jgi:DNA-binding transcriptional MocR family regulator
LPPVRALATGLGVSPATVAAAYRALGRRGLVRGEGRRGTVVAAQPPLRVGGARELPAGVRDLAGGNPDPALLPPLAPVLAALDPAHVLYGAPGKRPELVALARAEFAADGVAGDIAVLSGALDAIERAVQSHVRPGDAVAVEDPSWPRIADLLRALGARVEPAAVDGRGLRPGALERALARGARAVVVTPRGQNPTGAAVDAERGEALRAVLARHPDVLVIEDDYVAAVAGAPYVPLHGTTERFLVVRSLAKVLGPDLRVALAAGDPLTVSRVEGRQLAGPGWVSHLLQQAAARLLADPATRALLARAERAYAARRAALVGSLTRRGVPAVGHSGLGVWIGVEREAEAFQHLLARGWAVSPGERYRFNSAPGLRVTTAALSEDDAEQLAADLADAGSGGVTYAG